MAQGSGAQGGGGWAAAAIPILTATANAIGRGGPKRQYKYNKKMTDYQNKLNRENAQWAFDKELELRKFQMDYDSPEAQMQRFKDAGLNPNLIYGNGSAAAGSFEAPNFPSVPGVAAHQIDAAVLGNIGTEFAQARLMAAQTDFTETRTQESGVKQDLMRAQENVVKANPYLRPEYVDAMVTNLKSTAALKEQEASFMLSKVVPGLQPGDGTKWERGFLKMQSELNLLEQRFKLQSSDQKIKAQIIESKEFENALKEVQARWMKDAEITPQHIYQGIFMLLQSLMR